MRTTEAVYSKLVLRKSVSQVYLHLAETPRQAGKFYSDTGQGFWFALVGGSCHGEARGEPARSRAFCMIE